MPRLRPRRAAAALLGAMALLVLAVGLPALLLLPSCGGGAGHLTASVERLDFGRVDIGAEPERRFHIKNEGSRSVVIAGIQPTCACAHVRPGWRRSLGPGEDTEVVVYLVTHNLTRMKLEGKWVLVTSDDAKVPVIQIALHGDVENPVQIQPDVVRVGAGDAAGRGAPRRLRLRPAPGYEVTLHSIEVLQPDWFEVPVEKVPEGYDLLLTIKPDPARRGPVNTFVRLHGTITGKGLPPRKFDDLKVMISGAW